LLALQGVATFSLSLQMFEPCLVEIYRVEVLICVLKLFCCVSLTA
jgi:hypothetical protein